MSKSYTFKDFQTIIETLRSENGCPWDKEQTHNSLKPCMIEEAAEVAASIRIYEQTGDDTNLCEELGDVMLQVMLHSQIASEEGRFTLEDVIQGVCEKMIRRHPHVFGAARAESTNEVLANWEDIKRLEKEKQSYSQSELLDIPVELPALMRAQKVFHKIEKRAEEKTTLSDEKDQIFSILRQLDGKDNTQEETRNNVGNLLYHASALANKLKVDAEQALMDEIDIRISKEEEKTLKTPLK